MRELDTATLVGRAKHYASAFLNPVRERNGRPIDGPAYVMRDMFALTFKDEFDAVAAEIREWMSEKVMREFDRLAGDHFKPRDESVLKQLLADKLAIDMDGAHIPGKIGTTQVIGRRLVGTKSVEVETRDSRVYRRMMGLDKSHRQTRTKVVPDYWPIYAGEQEERAANTDADWLDPIPDGAPGMPVGATNPRISNECAILAADAIADNVDEGSTAATIRGRTGSQPADPDSTETGTLLFTLTMSGSGLWRRRGREPGRARNRVSHHRRQFGRCDRHSWILPNRCDRHRRGRPYRRRGGNQRGGLQLQHPVDRLRGDRLHDVPHPHGA